MFLTAVHEAHIESRVRNGRLGLLTDRECHSPGAVSDLRYYSHFHHAERNT